MRVMTFYILFPHLIVKSPLHPFQVSELTSNSARLSKEKDSALSKMSLWMKTCKQLEQEKQDMLNSSGVNI